MVEKVGKMKKWYYATHHEARTFISYMMMHTWWDVLAKLADNLSSFSKSAWDRFFIARASRLDCSRLQSGAVHSEDSGILFGLLASSRCARSRVFAGDKIIMTPATASPATATRSVLGLFFDMLVLLVEKAAVKLERLQWRREEVAQRHNVVLQNPLITTLLIPFTKPNMA